jgi:hypothetical protein
MMFEKGLGFTPKSLNPKHIIRPWWYQIGKEPGGVWQEFDHTENEQFFLQWNLGCKMPPSWYKGFLCKMLIKPLLSGSWSLESLGSRFKTFFKRWQTL